MYVIKATPLFDTSWEDAFIGIVFIFLIALVIGIQQNSSWQDMSTYSPRLAWLRGGVYFCSCFIISWTAGVFKTLTRTSWLPKQSIENPQWWMGTGLFLVIILIGYFFIWPKGTRNMGRPINLPAILIFGLAWGLSEGQLFLVLFSWVERFDLQPVTTGFISFLLIATFQGLWHGLYWDIKVAPDHNIKAWNLPKVSFVHVPNLSFGMYYLITFANPGIFLLMQTLGLIGGAYFMRFPGWSADKA